MKVQKCNVDRCEYRPDQRRYDVVIAARIELDGIKHEFYDERDGQRIRKVKPLKGCLIGNQ